MYVRLAFAVAAHLEPEILIVDEVLAVGDAEFQKKCLGKMQDVNKGDGRTILFVSHNMAAIKTLCKSGIFLKNGEVVFSGSIESALDTYQDDLRKNSFENKRITYSSANNKSLPAKILSVKVQDENGTLKEEFDVWDSVFIECEFAINKKDLTYVTPIINVEKDGVELFWSFASDLNQEIFNNWNEESYKFKVKLPTPLKKGFYNVSLKIGRLRVGDLDAVVPAVSFTIDEFSFDPTNLSYAGLRGGIVPALLEWNRLY
jgi:lipopolysaccharide transport system ATP-binding protein